MQTDNKDFHDLSMTSPWFPSPPVVMYDDIFDLSPSGIRQQDFHANSTFVSLASSLNLTLVYHLVQPDAYPDRSLLGEYTSGSFVLEYECQCSPLILSFERKSHKARHWDCGGCINSLSTYLLPPQLDRVAALNCKGFLLYKWQNVIQYSRSMGEHELILSRPSLLPADLSHKSHMKRHPIDSKITYD